jgi:hypothetical protein
MRLIPEPHQIVEHSRFRPPRSKKVRNRTRSNLALLESANICWSGEVHVGATEQARNDQHRSSEHRTVETLFFCIRLSRGPLLGVARRQHEKAPQATVEGLESGLHSLGSRLKQHRPEERNVIFAAPVFEPHGSNG